MVRDVVYPAISSEAGYQGYIVLASRESRKALGVTLWKSEVAREASDALARKIRPRVEQATGVTMQAVDPTKWSFFDPRV